MSTSSSRPPSSFPHERLDAYRVAREALVLGEGIARDLPRGYGTVSDQLRRALLSMHLGIAEAAARSGEEPPHCLSLRGLGGALTITMAIHPLAGRALPLVGLDRDRLGRRFVRVAHPWGCVLRLPVEWTDRVDPGRVPRIRGRAVRLLLRGLLQVAGLIEELRQRVAPPNAGTKLAADGEADIAVVAGAAGGRLAAAAVEGSNRDPRRLGHARAKGHPRSGGARGKR
jgi:hypothetical protein